MAHPLLTRATCVVALFVFTLSRYVDADVYNYPVKSINLADAMNVSFYVMNDGSPMSPVEDFHPVHGMQSSSGSFILVGKGIEGSYTKAFAIKLSSTGAYEASWVCNATSSAANAVVEMRFDHDNTIVAGWRNDSGVGHRFITKLGDDFNEVWTMTFDDTSGSNGALEMITLGNDGIILAGLRNKPTLDEMNFKSYGNVAGGNAWVGYLPLAVLAHSTAPAISALSWSYTNADYLTAKTAVELMSVGNVAVLLYAEESSNHATVQMLHINSTNSVSTAWGPTAYSSTQYEATDLQLTSDEAYVMLSGQGGPDGTYYAQLSKILASNGTLQWTKNYTAGGNADLIFNECWGMNVVPQISNQQWAGDEFMMVCGTGIEGCPSTLSASNLADCNAGFGDARPGAYYRQAAVWQTLVIRTDSDGTMLWQRVDSYKAPDGPEIGTGGFNTTSSAAEWGIVLENGGAYDEMAIITDEVSGIGLLKLKYGSTNFTNSPTASPTGGNPTATPTTSHTATPTYAPITSHTATPTDAPIGLPSNSPTGAPIAGPTNSPTVAATVNFNLWQQVAQGDSSGQLPWNYYNKIASDLTGQNLITATATNAFSGQQQWATEAAVYISSDYGETWSNTTLSSTNSWTSVASNSNGTILYAATYIEVNSTCGSSCGYTGLLYQSQDSGSTWNQMNTSIISISGTTGFSVACDSTGTTLAVAPYGSALYSTTDATAADPTWTQSNSGTQYWLEIKMSSDGQKLAGLNESSSVYVSADAGQSWTDVNPISGGQWKSISASSDGSSIMVAGDGGACSVDCFPGNSQVNSMGTCNYGTYPDTPCTDRYETCTTATGIWLSQNQGANWTASYPFFGFCDAGNHDIAAPQPPGLILHRDTVATTARSRRRDPSNPLWWSTGMSADGSTVAVGGYNNQLMDQFFMSEDSGTNWYQVEGAGTLSTASSAISINSDGSRLTVGAGGSNRGGGKVFTYNSNPTSAPTPAPTPEPTDAPSAAPTNNPTYSPTDQVAHTSSPSPPPTGSPTESPTDSPSGSPTNDTPAPTPPSGAAFDQSVAFADLDASSWNTDVALIYERGYGSALGLYTFGTDCGSGCWTSGSEVAAALQSRRDTTLTFSVTATGDSLASAQSTADSLSSTDLTIGITNAWSRAPASLKAAISVSDLPSASSLTVASVETVPAPAPTSSSIDMTNKYTIIVASVAAVLVLIFLILAVGICVMCCRRQRIKKASKMDGGDTDDDSGDMQSASAMELETKTME